MKDDKRDTLAPPPALAWAWLAGSLGSVAMGGLGLMAWATDNRLLGGLSAVYVPMAPLTALVFMALGAVSWRRKSRPRLGWVSWAVLACAGLAVVHGVLAFVLGLPPWLEQLLFPTSQTLGPIPLFRMSPFTGILFILASLAQVLLGLRWANREPPPHLPAALGALAALGGLVGAVGYLFGTPVLYDQDVIPIAATTSVGFMFLGLAQVCAAGPDTFLLRPLLGPSARARMLRVFLPLVMAEVLGHGLLHTRFPNLLNYNLTVVATVQALLVAAVTVILVLKLSKDIGGALQTSEEALRDSRETYRLLVENAREAIYVLSQGRLAWCNPVAQALTGCSPGQAPALRFVDLVHPEDQPRYLALCQGTNQDQAAWQHQSFRMVLAGREHWLQVNQVAITWQGGPAILGIARDVTPEHNLEAQYRQVQKMEAIGTLAGGIAHDFNNLLGVITGYAELMSEDLAGHPSAPDLEHILTAADRGKLLVSQLLAFSRKVEPSLRPVEINKLVSEAASMLERTIPRMVRLDTELNPEDLMVMGDGGQLQQVVMNLCANAAEAMHLGGRLGLETAVVSMDAVGGASLGLEAGSYARIRVSDNGPGMDQETLKHIFEPFYTTKPVGKGTGLGLASAYGIVVSHGGAIDCRSQPGEGTIFDVYLPMHWLQPSPAEDLPDPGEASIVGGETILLVDDDPGMRETGQRLLARQGYKVLLARSGEEALAIFETQDRAIDLVVLDLSMPGMGGYGCLRLLMAKHPQARVIISSGYVAQSQAQDTLAMGAKALVTKPFRGQEFLAVLRAVLKAPAA